MARVMLSLSGLSGKMKRYLFALHNDRDITDERRQRRVSMIDADGRRGNDHSAIIDAEY
jgi:hypothetical protein